MKAKYIIIILVILIVLSAGGYYWFVVRNKKSDKDVASSKDADATLNPSTSSATSTSKVNAISSKKPPLTNSVYKTGDNTRADTLVTNLNNTNVPLTSDMSSYVNQLSQMGYMLHYSKKQNKWSVIPKSSHTSKIGVLQNGIVVS